MIKLTLEPRGGCVRIESLRFLRSSEVTLGQGLLRKVGGEGWVSIYLPLKCLFMLLRTGLSISTWEGLVRLSLYSLSSISEMRVISSLDVVGQEARRNIVQE